MEHKGECFKNDYTIIIANIDIILIIKITYK